jgi:hypothetical protein
MFTDKLWITNGIKKVKNPAKYPGVTDVYQGQLQPNHDFKHQTTNFQKIKTSLEAFNIYPTEIYSATRAGKSCFTVGFSNPDIVWSKYEGEGYGSGQNFLYYKSYKINTTIWIILTHSDISRIFDGEDPDTVIQQRLQLMEVLAQINQ